jgi:hypothetical protein
MASTTAAFHERHANFDGINAVFITKFMSLWAELKDGIT